MKGERFGCIVRAGDEHGAQELDTDSCSPVRRFAVDSPTAEEREPTVTTSESRACSSVTIAVISLVMLAMARGLSRVMVREARSILSDQVPGGGRQFDRRRFRR